jgi:uncharacterized protein (DUF1015 family)
MATISPFRGVRYNAQRIHDLSQVVSQPYDRIRYGLQERYYDLSPYNVVRIVKGRELPTDVTDRPAGPNVYTRARAYYDLWTTEGVLGREDRPALYAYHQIFDVHGETQTRKGYIAALELTSFDQGIVLPHERTHAGPKLDRLRLLHNLEVNMGQIFMLYPDRGNRVNAILDASISGRAPDVDVVELLENDVRHQLWTITDPSTITAVQEEMAPKRNLIIADGHHRYETALTYRDEMLCSLAKAHLDAPIDAGLRWRMVTLVSMEDPALIIFPTHREVLGYSGGNAAEIAARAEKDFQVIPASDMAHCFATMQAHEAEHAFGLYMEGRYWVLVLRNLDQAVARMDRQRSLSWRSLDVSILHTILLEDILGLPKQAVEEQQHLRYHRDPVLAIESVDVGEGELVFFLNPTRMDQVKVCAAQGEPMPQKSTDFYPKMITGLVMMPVGPDERMEAPRRTSTGK